MELRFYGFRGFFCVLCLLFFSCLHVESWVVFARYMITTTNNLTRLEKLRRQKQRDIKGVALLADRISLAHAKDRRADGSFVAAGKGDIDFPHYLAVLRSINYDGDIIAHGLQPHEAADVSRFLKSILSEGV